MHHIVAPGFVDRPRRSDCTAGQIDGEAGWCTTSGNIGLPSLARVMEVGRQQHVNHMHGMQYQIVLNIIFWPEINEYNCTKLCVQFLHKTATLIYAVKAPFSRLSRHTLVKAVM